MKRGYTAEQYRRLVQRVRHIIPDVAIHNDIIVGFPGETEAQFQHTVDLAGRVRARQDSPGSLQSTPRHGERTTHD
ncbi:MAG: hypothetical protein M5U34_21005 [Chloroflexi bacterium]|nr:hypothetical protein [Chloroflexota bacterium]